MDWTRGYGPTSYHVRRVDPSTWGDAEELFAGRLRSVELSASVAGEREEDGYSPTIDSGDLSVTGDGVEAGTVVRVWVETSQAGEPACEPLGTYVVSSSHSVDGRTDMELSSVLEAARDGDMGGWQAPAGARRTTVAASLLRAVVDAPVTDDGGAGDVDPLATASFGDGPLSCAWMTLVPGGELYVDAWGTVHARAAGSEPTALTGADMVGAPDAMHDYGDGEVEYSRMWRPNIRCGDLVALPGRTGAWRVTSQSVECGAAILVDETAVEVTA